MGCARAAMGTTPEAKTKLHNLFLQLAIPLMQHIAREPNVEEIGDQFHMLTKVIKQYNDDFGKDFTQSLASLLTGQLDGSLERCVKRQ